MCEINLPLHAGIRHGPNLLYIPLLTHPTHRGVNRSSSPEARRSLDLLPEPQALIGFACRAETVIEQTPCVKNLAR